MTPNEYQELAMRTAAGMNYSTFSPLVNCGLGITGEAGEVADLIKKTVFQNHELDYEHFAKELGDVMWYVALGAEVSGYSLERIMEMNIDKLAKRYPNGFETFRSTHRSKGDI